MSGEEHTQPISTFIRGNDGAIGETINYPEADRQLVLSGNIFLFFLFLY